MVTSAVCLFIIEKPRIFEQNTACRIFHNVFYKIKYICFKEISRGKRLKEKRFAVIDFYRANLLLIYSRACIDCFIINIMHVLSLLRTNALANGHVRYTCNSNKQAYNKSNCVVWQGKSLVFPHRLKTLLKIRSEINESKFARKIRTALSVFFSANSSRTYITCRLFKFISSQCETHA